jgi:dUTPase
MGDDGAATLVDLGVRARCLRDGAWAPYLLVPRSSLGLSPLSLANSIGIIDKGYVGSLKVALRNHSKSPYKVERGVSLVQLALPDQTPACVLVNEPSDPKFSPSSSVRGEGGHGSTGAKGTTY